jgi:putative DNA primase/helicase
MFGTSREESIIYLYGTGNDGKGVILYIKNKIMGGYSSPAEYKTFASMGKSGRGFGGHSDDIAALAGKRDIYVDETDAGGRLNEGLIKTITGNGRQKASFKGKSGFEFDPQFTMWWASNFKPRLTDVGKSMRRRIKMVHMNLGLDEDKADKTLKTRLVSEEGDAILTWMVEGAIEWYQKGLSAPAAVREWTDQYFHDEDVVGMWLEECCKQAPGFTVRATPAFKAFKSFCIENGYHHEHIDMKAFKKQLESKGFEQKPTKFANEWRGFMVERFFLGEEPKIDADSAGAVT